ncbi:zinc ribbon domain-containing protein [Desulfopila sp. IMCC35008]|uniref:FmdB family zinc ribbon protein n=1 Tax=Desulfopila sp. IMCC35008 TaxID=2653858 RepID=UPI0013D50398|nr:zinc ribbon domain-containing protein [Desulfopila sp. IMCC35008]
MPIYEYECSECKTVFETLVTSASTETEVACTKCSSTKVQKIMSAGSLRVGSGGGLPIAPPHGGGCGGGSGFS